MIIAQKYLFAVAAISLLSICNPTNAQSDIQGIRLANGTYGSHMGTLELKYNGTWGTVCDGLWSFFDARVACRMLGYEDAVCAVTRSRFGRSPRNGAIWMDNVQCLGTEDDLGECDFNGWGIDARSCNPRRRAGVVCEDKSLIGVPDNIRLVESTTRSLTIGWTIPSFPEEIQSVRYRISFQSPTDTFTRTRFYFPSFSTNGTREEITYTLPLLERDTEYTIQIRAEVRYPLFPLLCTSYMLGNYSDPVVFRTNSTLKRSNIRVRLVPPESGLKFMGRVEVFYSGSWGTVCDDLFSTSEANVICGMLNYTDGSLCTVRGAGFGQGTGRIWLDNVNCNTGDEVLEDCDFNPWGINNCNHRDDVGVICRPNDDDFLAPVENFTISHVASTSITVRWNRYRFPSGVTQSQFRIQYFDEFFGFIFPRVLTIPASQTEYTLTRLQFGREYNLTIRPAVRFSQCRFNTLFGPFSDEVSAVTQETAPTGPPTSFHVVVLNSTAVDVQFDLPLFEHRNGVIRGYKIFVDPADGGGDELVFDVMGNTTSAYIVSGLKPATAYIFSALAYTVADGPRSIHLTAITNPVGFDVQIVRFGINGNGLDKETRFTFQRDLHIHCSPSHPANSTVDWFFSNGTKVGNNNRNIREGHYANGTAVLQIASDRRLSYCDAGVYTCVVNTSDKIEKKNFTLVINTTPPPPSRPTSLEVKSDSITIGWSESLCDGGHQLDSFTIQHTEDDISFFFRSTVFIRNIDPRRRNYTITGLDPDSSYRIGIQAVSVERRGGAYSPFASFSTLPPAPSAPRDITIKLIRPLLIEVRWRVPAVRNRQIVQYIVYAIPLIFTEPTRTKRQTEPTVPPKTIKKVFPGSARAGNITLVDHSVTYQIRVSAAIMSGETLNEGELSSITINTTVFIPEPGIPTPVNLRSTTTNSSVSLLWDYPPPPVEIIKNFVVAYSAQVDWRSPDGTLIRFTDSGQATTTGTSLKVSQLIPGTNYLFKVSANTEKGRGADVTIVSQTLRPQSNAERLAFFQLRIGPIGSCIEFMDVTGNTTEKLLQVRKGLAEELTHVCPSCGLTFANIKDDEFSCRGGLTNYIIYRARIVGTDMYSAPRLVSLIQTWVASGTASISIQSISRLHLDPTCPTSLDTLRSPDCPMAPSPPVSTDAKPDAKTTEEDKGRIGQSAAVASAGEVGGIVVGALVVVLLVILIVVVTIFMMRRWKPKVPGMRNGNGHTHLDEDKTPFADIASSHEEGLEKKYFAEKPNTNL